MGGTASASHGLGITDYPFFAPPSGHDEIEGDVAAAPVVPGFACGSLLAVLGALLAFLALL